ISGLELCILRPAVVYGAGDINGLMPRIVCGRVYQHLDEKMKLLGTPDLAISTVHVEDVVKAIWMAKDMAPGSVYNVADSAHFTVGDMNDLLAEVFGIKTGFVSGIMNGLARKAFSMAVNQAFSMAVNQGFSMAVNHIFLSLSLSMPSAWLST
ncbi:hypothetical protein KIPB_011501, partial [Kipferlia bialata]